jgi:hypothetical protein
MKIMKKISKVIGIPSRAFCLLINAVIKALSTGLAAQVGFASSINLILASISSMVLIVLFAGTPGGHQQYDISQNERA